jgi:hypothetical protein
MMQLAPRAASAVPQTLATSLTELPFGAQTQVRVGDGHLAAFLAYVAYDRRICVAKYALRVLNNTPFPVQAKLFVESRGVQLSAYPRAVDIAPYSMRDEIIPVRMDVTGWFDRAIVHVASEESAFTVEAPPPPRERPKWARWTAAAIVPLLAAGTTQFCQPRVLDVAAPPKAIAGSTIHVPFQVAGVGSVEYDFDTRDGLQLAAGLSSRSDVLNLQIPQDGVGAPYTLHVRMRNAFAKDERTASIAAVVPPKPKTAAAAAAPAALIDNLAVSPSPAVAGKTIAIRYATKAESGDVWLLDTSGATWAHAPLSLYGSTELTIPPAAAGKDMRIVLHAQRGAQHAQSSVDVQVMASPQITAQASAPAPTAKPAARPAPTAQLQLSSSVVSAGETVTATITGVTGDVRVTLTNSYGGTMAEGNATEGQGVTLNAPDVSTPTTFYVVATLTNGVSQQSIVKRLVVTPR